MAFSVTDLDVYGRLLCLCLYSILGLFTIAAAFSPDYPVLLVLRGIASIGIGGAQALTYPMLLEFLPVKKKR